MTGVRANLAAGLEQRAAETAAWARRAARTKSRWPMCWDFLCAKKLTGEAPPRSVAGAVEQWRDFIQEKAGADLDRLAGVLRDQAGVRPP